jgi:hypothetical protein
MVFLAVRSGTSSCSIADDTFYVDLPQVPSFPSVPPGLHLELELKGYMINLRAFFGDQTLAVITSKQVMAYKNKRYADGRGLVDQAVL